MLCSNGHIDHHQPQTQHDQLLQMGTAAGNSSNWAQRMMMMPATNSSPSTATKTSAPGSVPPASAPSASTSSSTVGEKPMARQQQQAAAAAAAVAPLPCPRCDSSNTKFCYYNNYSLSQPRHFCKACKRYWTRGGTLRNVPVGGGCRKNKRAKKQTSNTATTTSAGPTTVTAAATAAARSDQQLQPSLVSSSSPADLSSFFYASSDMNHGSLSYDCLGEIGGLISNSNPSSLINTNLSNLQKQQQPPVSSSYFDNHYSSLLVSSMKHQQSKNMEEYAQSLLPYYGLQQANLGFLKDMKVEGDNNLMGSSSNFSTDQWGANNYAFEAISGGGGGALISDTSCLDYWNPAMGGGGGWLDAANPSVAPLI